MIEPVHHAARAGARAAPVPTRQARSRHGRYGASALRSRGDLVGTKGVPRFRPPPEDRTKAVSGGLGFRWTSASAWRVDVHLGESINLAMLAEVAGLSMHHFAREFKHSAGITPHLYLTQKRVERAQQMLAQTSLPLSEIAYATGFSDQGHLARHFRHMIGTTPREFRWSQR